ncbi:MAG: hypothetical protein QM784_10280 [Polyangiaceae bacterium]
MSVQPKIKTNHVVTSVASPSNAHHVNASISVSEVRDELVRVVMPELRVLMEHLVAGAVERAIAPLLEKQHELEDALKELRTVQARAVQPTAVAKPATQVVSARVAPAESYPAPAVNTAVYREPPQPNVAVYREPAKAEFNGYRDAPVPTTATPNGEPANRVNLATGRSSRLDTLEDIPSELNGSRRKKFLMVAFAVAVFVLILSAVGLSVMSNLGTHL